VVLAASSYDIPIELAERPSEMAARLLLALTALYVQRPTHTVEEQQQYSELALRLIDKVGAATHTAVADLLQRHPDAPAEVTERFGGMQFSRDGDPKPEPHSALDQRGAPQLKGNQHLGIGQRASTEPASDAPARGQPATRTPEFGEAFFAASAAERRRMLSLIADSDSPAPARKDSERAFASIDAAALHGRIGEFSREFERLIDIPRSLCERILHDPSGEPMVVAAKAAGMPIAIVQRILLNPAAGHSVERGTAVAMLPYPSCPRAFGRGLAR
jgi:hypothetical protein